MILSQKNIILQKHKFCEYKNIPSGDIYNTNTFEQTMKHVHTNYEYKTVKAATNLHNEIQMSNGRSIIAIGNSHNQKIRERDFNE